MRYVTILRLLLACLNFTASAKSSSTPQLQALTFKQNVDHFSYGVQDKFFKQKYLVNTDHWNKTSGPIFFYTGNEGPVDMFVQSTGFMFDIAPEFGAMIVFAEHRYYGDSMPFGNKAYTQKKYYQYQSSTQALMDYAKLINHIKRRHKGAANSPVVVFGGSYGGLLSAYMRIKYPHVVQGAIAASAPVAQYTGMMPCNKFSQAVTKDFYDESADCAKIIRKSWSAIDTMAATDKGRGWLTKEWKLCSPLVSSNDGIRLKAFLAGLWPILAMTDYPYKADFMLHLPAYPIKAVCKPMKYNSDAPESILTELFKGLQVYGNYSFPQNCLTYKKSVIDTAVATGWSLQVCTELVIPMCHDNKGDFFEAYQWNQTSFDEACFKRWGVHPEPYKMELLYGGRNIKSASNIVFSNGLLDPWHVGGILEDINDSVIAVVIPGAAHHMDLRGSNPADPQSVIDARNVHRTNIRKWIKQYRQQMKMANT